MKKWIVREQDIIKTDQLAASAGISRFAARLLLNRGITDRDAADLFFNDEKINNPNEIKDMAIAATIIEETMDNGDKITVYGDYDCDGITATVILYSYLEAMGANVDWYIPSRDEGYGLNKKAIDYLEQNGTKLVVTVDNGISAVEEAEYLKEKNIDLIITDHHQVPEILPYAKAVVDPHRPDDNSKYKDLAGCGVALKLVMSIEGDFESVLENWGDLAAIGTVGDLVPLTGENRVIVKRGLESLKTTSNGGLAALLRQCGIHQEDDISSVAAAFAICPRINAAGRFAHPKEAANLFLCQNPKMYNQMAENLTVLNLQRQDEEKSILEDISRMINENPLIIKSRVIIVSGKGWRHGVIGIVAAKLLNKFGKPVMVITEEGEASRGSARSVEGFSLFAMLTKLSDMLVKFGGHTKAAGFTIETDKIPQFIKAVEEYAKNNFPQMPKDSCTAETVLPMRELVLENIEELKYFQPFGEGNPSPVFCLKNCKIMSRKSLKEGKYVGFTVQLEGKDFKIVNFNCGYNEFCYREGDTVDLLVTAEPAVYNNTRYISLKLEDIMYSGFSQERYFAAEDAYESLCRGEAVPSALSKRIIPDRTTQMAVYDIVKANSDIFACSALAYKKGINYCMFRVTLDLFESVGLMKINHFDNKVTLQKPTHKADLEHCEFIEELRKKLQ